MQCQEFDINAAEGVRLLSEINLGGQIFPKGHALTQEDIILFKMFNIRRIKGALMDDSDIDAPTALGIVAAKLCGSNTAFNIDKEGHCQIVSLNKGILMTSSERLSKFNRLHEDFVLNTLEPYSLVEPNQVVAKLEMRMPIIAQAEVDEIIFKLSGNTSLIEVSKVESRRSALIYAKLTGDDAETELFTAAVKNLVTVTSGLELDFDKEYNASYTVESVADEIEQAMRSGHEICFVLPALPSAGRQDVVPSALAQIMDEIACSYLPVLSASDFFVAQKRNHKIICLPHNYGRIHSSLLNETIKQAIFSEKLHAQDFSHLQIPVFKETNILAEDDQKALIMPKNYGTSGRKANIAAIVLAAGQGRRAGRNKLMADIGDNKPLFMNAVEAAIRSDASPVFVITGYHADEMQAFLDEVDVNIIYNPAYHAGVRTSIELGLKSVPNFCNGAMIIPADMPNLTAADLNKLIAKFKPDAEKQVVMFSCHGVKSNPIIWSQSLFDKADIVPENAQMRPVFMEHSDYTVLVDIKDRNKLLDVTFAADIASLVPKEQK